MKEYIKYVNECGCYMAVFDTKAHPFSHLTVSQLLLHSKQFPTPL